MSLFFLRYVREGRLSINHVPVRLATSWQLSLFLTSATSFVEKGSNLLVPNRGYMGTVPHLPLEYLLQIFSLAGSVGPDIVMQEDSIIPPHVWLFIESFIFFGGLPKDCDRHLPLEYNESQEYDYMIRQEFSSTTRNHDPQIYRDINSAATIRLFKDAMGAEFAFMELRLHRETIVGECLEEENIFLLEWPVFSPDLNPVEHVWDNLGRRVVARHPFP
ncbi:hypothetical protein AVEN_145409-1 [Araneus ventricosus]|uniref:Tc1-like transposase DDE domain-containing protein n=1 Tax=Araneus ventricosus TaxID=182803 RepID=A0A4Y2H544_ARAVE|nr:hypothetical protein AVEN_145409-1 [Araneus ventricosus]